MGETGRLRGIVRRSSWIFAAKLLLMLVTIAFAASISITSNNYQAEIGSAVNVTGNLVLMDRGFSLAGSSSSANGANCPSAPIPFSATPGTANTTITAGHLVFTVRVNSTTTATPSHTFNVTFVLGSSTYGPLCVRTPSSPQNSQYIDCKFDAVNGLPASPYVFNITVQ